MCHFTCRTLVTNPFLRSCFGCEPISSFVGCARTAFSFPNCSGCRAVAETAHCAKAETAKAHQHSTILENKDAIIYLHARVSATSAPTLLQC